MLLKVILWANKKEYTLEYDLDNWKEIELELSLGFEKEQLSDSRKVYLLESVLVPRLVN